MPTKQDGNSHTTNDSLADAYPNRHAHTDADTICHSDTHGDSYPLADQDGNTHTKRHRHAGCDTHRQRDAVDPLALPAADHAPLTGQQMTKVSCTEGLFFI